MVLSHLFIDLWLFSLIYYDWSPPAAGGGIRTCDLVVERSVCNPTELYLSSPPSGTQNTFRIYPTPSEFIQHLQNLSNIFRIYPTPSEFTQHLHNLPNTFRIYPPPSEFSQDLHNSPTTFRIHPPPSEKNLFWGRWTFLDLFGPFPKNPKIPKTSVLSKMIFWKNSMKK